MKLDHRRLRTVAALGAVAGTFALCGCESRGALPTASPSAPTSTASTSTASTSTAPPSPKAPVPSASAAPPPPPAPGTSGADAPEIDARFRTLERGLPEPATLSEQNGMTMVCSDGSHATYTHIAALGAKVPVRSDADLPALVPWARHANACLRQIAIEAILRHIAYDRNALSAPGMHTPDDHHFHDIMLSLKGHLDQKHIGYRDAVFANLFLTVTERDFPAIVRGAWTEVGEKKNFSDFVEVEAEQLRVTSKHTFDDPKHADTTWTTKIDRVTVNERRQFVVTGAWNVESNDKGYQGDKVQPSQFVYTFWPVAPGVVWFKNGEHAYWTKLARAR